MCSSQVLEKLLGWLDSLALVWQLVLEKKNSEIKPALLYLKIDLVSYTAYGGEVG